jgi:hypothetical protein
MRKKIRVSKRTWPRLVQRRANEASRIAVLGLAFGQGWTAPNFLDLKVMTVPREKSANEP